MFSQPSEKESTSTKASHKQKSIHKKRKRQKQKNKRTALQTKQNLANTMSTWAENFTIAATWQLKHQVAMWKSKATALEYENQILRETLRKFYVNGGKSRDSTAHSSWNVYRENTQLKDYEQSYTDCEPSFSSNRQYVEESSETEEEEGSELELEISDEYMAFLRQNFEFRKAREERKQREAEEERMSKEAQINDPQPSQDRTEEFKELYGDSWQRIAALDSNMLSEYISLCDIEKPSYWPNIPLRF